MAKRRANGEGTLEKLENGKWKAIAVVGWRASGKPIRRTKTHRSHADATKWLSEIRNTHRTADGGQTVAQHVEAWVEGWVKHNRAHNTYLSYRQQIDKHIIPRLGSVKLKSLTPMKVQAFIDSMQADGVPSATRKYVVRVLNTVLCRAAKLQAIPVAPTAYVDRPTHRPEEIHPFTEDEAEKILDFTAGNPLEGVYRLALSTGARQGEIFGAYWEDFDLARKVWSIRRQLVYSSGSRVNQPLKTLASVRNIDLTDAVIEALRERRKEAMRRGHAGSPFVFCGVKGGHIWPTTFWDREWKPLLKELEIQHRGFHHCRHTAATLMIGAGVAINVVAYILGHSNPTTTLKIYAHYLPSQQQQATDVIRKLFG